MYDIFVCLCVYLLSLLSDGCRGLNERRKVSVCVAQKSRRPILTAIHTHTHAHTQTHTHTDAYFDCCT